MPARVHDADDPPEPSSTRLPRHTLVGAVAISFIWAAACNFLVDFLQGVASGAGRGLSEGPVLFLLNSTVLWLGLLLLMCLSGRLWIPVALATALTIVVGMVNYDKIRLRVEPVYPADLTFVRQPGFLLTMSDASTLVRTAILLLVGLALVVLLARILGRRSPRMRPHRWTSPWRVLVGLRALGALVAVLLLVSLTHFNRPGDMLRRVYDAAGADWVPDTQQANYVRNGFVAGILYNLAAPVIEPPAGYSEARMRSIVATYAARAARTNVGRDPGALDDVNVVVVLSESLSDPTRLRGVSTSEDPLPYTRALARRVPSGQALAQHIGGGTANMGFETLTGMSMSEFSPQLTYPYSMLLPHYDSWPSAVGFMRAHGHDATAIHPFDPRIYRRDLAYPVLGFQRFVHDTTMHFTKRIEHNRYISDESAFDEVRYQIDHTRKPLFVNLVTMQNHYPWGGSYDHPVRVTGLDDDSAQRAGDYARGVRYSDKALEQFLAKLDRSSEKTLVLVYGDHLPSVWPASVQELNGLQAMHQTPFLLWSNYRRLAPERLPTTSPAYFLPLLLDAADAPLPPYYVLLLELHAAVPARLGDLSLDPSGELVPADDLSPRARRLLEDYRLVVYDLSVGKRYSQSGLFYEPGGSTDATASAAGE